MIMVKRKAKDKQCDQTVELALFALSLKCKVDLFMLSHEKKAESTFSQPSEAQASPKGESQS